MTLLPPWPLNDYCFALKSFSERQPKFVLLAFLFPVCLQKTKPEFGDVWTLKGATGQKAKKVKLGQAVLTWADLSQAKIWTDPAYQRHQRYLAIDHVAVAQERKMQANGIEHIRVISEDKLEHTVSVASFDALLPTGSDLVLVESSGPPPLFTAENVRTMVGLIGPETGWWVWWMMAKIVEMTPWHVHTFPCFTPTDDRMWDAKKPRKMLYQNLHISMVTEQQVSETRRPNYVTSTVPWRLSFLIFLIRAVSTSMPNRNLKGAR